MHVRLPPRCDDNEGFRCLAKSCAEVRATCLWLVFGSAWKGRCMHYTRCYQLPMATPAATNSRWVFRDLSGCNSPPPPPPPIVVECNAIYDATREVTDISRIVQGQAAGGRARQLLAATGSVPAPWWLAQYGVNYG
jgi:hypothetical protein